MHHHDSPDAPHIAAAPGALLSCDSACPPDADPGDATPAAPRQPFADDELSREESSAILASLRDGTARPTLQPRRIGHADSPSPPLPQSHPEAARHCLHLIEAAVPEPLVANIWAAVEAVERAKAAEVRAACAKVAKRYEPSVDAYCEVDTMQSSAWDRASHDIAAAIEALPLEPPRE